MTETKRCTQCGKTKPAEDFYRDKSMSDGRRSECKECKRLLIKDWERRNPEQRAKAAERWARRNKGRLRELNQRAKERADAKTPERAEARRLLKQAVRWGDIVKPNVCEGCGESFERRLLHGHHEDYSRPLEVEWLCRTCHEARHKQPKEESMNAEREMATSDGLGGERPARRWAIVVVVEAETADAALTEVRATLETYLPAVNEPGAPEATPVYVGDACPMGPASEYETEQIRLRADGEIAYTAPDA